MVRVYVSIDALGTPAPSCTLGAYDEIDVAIENLKQPHELIDRFVVVRLIQESIQLSG